MSYNYLNKINKIILLSCFVLCATTSWAAKPPQVWNIPAENPNFIGREEALDNIYNIFKTSDTKTAVISGSQGFGKTQIAKRYAYNNFSEYDVVWWFKANRYLKPQFEQFALMIAPIVGLDIKDSIKTIGHDHLIKMIKEAVRRKNLKSLIIFDDATSYKDIEPYILYSHQNNIHTIVTTKNSNFSTKSLHIKPFKRDESLQFIRLSLNNETDDAQDHLASQLNDCPVALAVSVDYIKNYPGMNIIKYIKSYEANKSLPIFNVGSNKFGSLSDGYQKDLMAAVELNIRELKQQSAEAFRLLSLMYLLPHDTITLEFLTKWLKLRNYKTDVMKLLSLINQYSLIEMSPVNKNGRVTINMHELIQNSISKVLSTSEKRKLIDEASQILKEPFTGNTEKVAKLVLKDDSYLLQAIKLSQEADLIDYHIPNLAAIRVSALNIILGCIRDNETSNIIIKHLQKDIENKIQFTQEDELLYNANMALFSAVYSPDYEKAISYGLKAYSLATEIGNIEEKVRVIANLIQHYVLIGNMQEAEKMVKEGEKYLSQSKSDVYNAVVYLCQDASIVRPRQISRDNQCYSKIRTPYEEK